MVRRSQFNWSIVLLLVLAVQFGCGGGGQGDATVVDNNPDVQRISQLVGGASDLASQGLTALRGSFTKDAAPNQAKVQQFKESFFAIEGDVAVSGTTATIPVRVNSYASGPGPLVTWKATKEGDDWKLSDAPLK